MSFKTYAQHLCSLMLALFALGVNAATLVVTNNSDSGAGSLRGALSSAASGDVITFNDPITITLASTLEITKGLTINGDLNGDGKPDVIIDGNDSVRVVAVKTTEPVALNGLLLTKGRASDGGAGVHLAAHAVVTMANVEVSHCVEASKGGGGIFGDLARLVLTDSTVKNNISGYFGGGIRLVGSSSLTIIRSTIAGNSTTGEGANGGGIQFSGSTQLEALRIENSTITGNAAKGSAAGGGGLRVTEGVAVIRNTTIVGNSAGNMGGGLFANGFETLVNVVVAGNQSGTGATAGANGSPLASGGIPDDVAGIIESSTYNYFGTNALRLGDQGSLNNQGTVRLGLGLLSDNGGPTLTHLPLPGSALLDAAPCLSEIPTDQRGIARPVGQQSGSARCDIGSVELPPRYKLTVNASEGGTVDAGATPAPFDGSIHACSSANSGSCEAQYFVADSVTLTAAASTGFLFRGWSGACAGTQATCLVSGVDADQTVSAQFTPVLSTFTGITVPSEGVAAGAATASFTGGGSVCSFDLERTSFVAAPASLPSGQTMPHGMLAFVLIGCDSTPVTMSIAWPTSVEGASKWGKATQDAESPSHFAPAMLSVNDKVTQFQVQDGQLGDDDWQINGEIVDPVGATIPIPRVVEPIPVNPPTPVPTLSQWALILLSLLAVALGLNAQRRKMHA